MRNVGRSFSPKLPRTQALVLHSHSPKNLPPAAQDHVQTCVVLSLRNRSHQEQDEREGSPPHVMKLQRASFNRFASFGVSRHCIQHYSEVFKQVVLNEAEWLEDANVEFLLQLESPYSKNFELPLLKGTHQLGVVESTTYET